VAAAAADTAPIASRSRRRTTRRTAAPVAHHTARSPRPRVSDSSTVHAVADATTTAPVATSATVAVARRASRAGAPAGGADRRRSRPRTAEPAPRKDALLYIPWAITWSPAATWKPSPTSTRVNPSWAIVDQASWPLVSGRVVMTASATMHVIPPSTTAATARARAASDEVATSDPWRSSTSTPLATTPAWRTAEAGAGAAKVSGSHRMNGPAAPRVAAATTTSTAARATGPLPVRVRTTAVARAASPTRKARARRADRPASASAGPVRTRATVRALVNNQPTRTSSRGSASVVTATAASRRGPTTAKRRW